MSAPDAGTPFLDEFRQFLTFLQNLWGLLTGISVLFPLSNVLVKVIPLQSLDYDGAFAKLAPSLVTTVATITTLFLVFWTFSHRGQFKDQTQRRVVQRRAMFSFGAGFASIVLYLVGYTVKLTAAYDVWGWESQDPRHLLAEVPLLIAYVAAFALVTRAFLLLAMMEFFFKDSTS
jgi:hypothetical protein